MGEPLDLDKAPAAQGGTPLPFTFRGRAYEFPPPARWPVAAVQMISSGQALEGLAELVGEEDARALIDDGLTVGHLNAVIEAAGREPAPPRPWWRRRA